jgi:hypothetical protein
MLFRRYLADVCGTRRRLLSLCCALIGTLITSASDAAVRVIDEPLTVPPDSASLSVTLKDDEAPLVFALCKLQRDLPTPNGIRIIVSLDAKSYQIAGPRESVLKAVDMAKRSRLPVPQTLIDTQIVEMSSRRARDFVLRLKERIGVLSPEMRTELRVMEQKGQVRVLAAPRLLAVDGSEASFGMGDKIVFDSGGSSTESERDTGLELKIIPHALASGDREMSFTGSTFRNGRSPNTISGSLTLKLGQEAAVVLLDVPPNRGRRKSRARTILVLCSPQEYDARKLEALSGN